MKRVIRNEGEKRGMTENCIARFHNTKDFSILDGKTLTGIEGLYAGSDCIIFQCSDGTTFKLYHQQDGSEQVMVTEVSAFDRFGGVIKTESERKRVLLGTKVNTLEPFFKSSVDESMVFSSLDSPFNAHPPLAITQAQSETIFTVYTELGVLFIVWFGVAYDRETSTEVDFVQIAGPGLWVDDNDKPRE